MRRTIRSVQLLSLIAIGAMGCASTATVTETAPDEQATPQAVAIQPASAPSLDPVYFDMDKAVLRRDARASLETRAEAIQQHPDWGIVSIQGHCDERGSDEYNLALGQRRAQAVKSYLVDLGVHASRLETVTFGESRPAVAGHTEGAWRYNRRSELAKQTLQSATR